jgi:hypothetical protein
VILLELLLIPAEIVAIVLTSKKTPMYLPSVAWLAFGLLCLAFGYYGRSWQQWYSFILSKITAGVFDFTGM